MRLIAQTIRSALVSTLLILVTSTPAYAAQWTPTPASLRGRVQAGTIVISYRQRQLYLVYNDSQSLRYPVAVPKAGRTWFGEAAIASKHVHPDWVPPQAVRAAHPELPDFIAGGSPSNPMGTRAMMLTRSEIAIHGTANKMRSSIGTAASFGCIRMLNEDVQDLFNRVDVGTPVIMMPSL